VEENVRVLISDVMVVFAWKYCGKPQKASVSVFGVGVEI
jgi:hypothetical protein